MKQTVFPVTAFGALPDPTVDSTDAFQKAMDEAAKVGGVVTIPSGRWYVGELRIPAGITICGTYTWNWSSFDGYHGTIITLNQEHATCCFDMTHAYGTHLKGIAIDGRRLGKDIHGLYIHRDDFDQREDQIKIDGCRIGHFSGDSVRFQYVRGFSVHHSMLCFSKGWSLYLTGTDGSLYDNWFSDSDTGNIAFGGVASFIRIFCNRCEDSPKGVDMDLFVPMGNEPLEGCHDIIIASNCFCGSPRGGIRAVGTPQSVMKNITLWGNTFNVNGGEYGMMLEPLSSHIWVEYLSNSVISGNTLFAGRGFFDPNALVRPSYGMVLAHLDNCVISNNGMNFSSLFAPFRNEGRHTGNLIMHNNCGREVPQLDGYLFPWWTMRQFPEAKAQQDQKARDYSC